MVVTRAVLLYSYAFFPTSFSSFHFFSLLAFSFFLYYDHKITEYIIKASTEAAIRDSVFVIKF